MKNFDMKRILEKLSNERKVFHSEADFQFSLAWKIKEEYSDYKIYLEWPVLTEDKNKYIDIVLEKDGKIIPIELKYKTKELKYKNFNLKDHGARNLACYDYWKDIERVESLIINTNFEKGFCIFLTNDLGFLNKPRSNVGYKDFSIYENKRIFKKQLNWGKNIRKDNLNRRKEPINLKFNYQFNWENYCILKDSKLNNDFRYLFTEIKNI